MAKMASSTHRDPDFSLVIERVHRVVGLIEFDESDGTTFLWSNTSGVDVHVRCPHAAGSVPLGANGVPVDCPRCEVAEVRPILSSSGLPADMDSCVKKVAQWFVQCDVNESQDPHEQQQAAAAAAAAASSSSGATSSHGAAADGGGQTAFTTNDSPAMSTSYPQTPLTSIYGSGLHSPSTFGVGGGAHISAQHQQQQQQQQQFQYTSSSLYGGRGGLFQAEPPVADLHWLHFSDVVTHAPVDASSSRRPQPHFVRACACRFEVPDAFARGFSRLFVVMSATLVRCTGSGAEWAQDLLAAACNPSHTLDAYDAIGEYVVRAQKCFEARFASFLPRCLETLEANVERAKQAKEDKDVWELKQKRVVIEEAESAAAAVSPMEDGKNGGGSSSSSMLMMKDGTACPAEEKNDDSTTTTAAAAKDGGNNDEGEMNRRTSTTTFAPSSSSSPTSPTWNSTYRGPSLVKLEDARQLLALAPHLPPGASMIAPDTFKIEEEIRLRAAQVQKQQQQQQQAISKLLLSDGGGGVASPASPVGAAAAAAAAGAAASVPSSLEDTILHWCLKRGTRGNLAPFEQVFSIYGGGGGESGPVDSPYFAAALERQSLVEACSLNQAAPQMVASLRDIFCEADAPASQYNSSVSVSLYSNASGSGSSASASLQQDFLVDPKLSQDPAAWPGLLWNATDYLKVLRKDAQVASDNNSLCIGATHFFA